MSTVADLYGITKQLQDILLATTLEDTREVTINRINDCLAQRQQIIEKLPKKYSNEEKRLGKKIVDMNETNSKQLNKLLAKIKLDIMFVNKKRQSTQKYVNPYQNISRDGMFLDKRK